MSVVVKYKDNIIATAFNGQVIELECAGHKFSENLYVESHGKAQVVEPVSMSTEAEMSELLNNATIYDSGKVFQYSGEGQYFLGATNALESLSSIGASLLTENTVGTEYFPIQLYKLTIQTTDIETGETGEGGEPTTEPKEVEVWDEITSPKEGAEYYLRLIKNEIPHYFSGIAENGQLLTTTDKEAAQIVKAIKVLGDDITTVVGYHFYFVKDLINMYLDLNELAASLTTEMPTKPFVYNALGAWEKVFSDYVKGAYYRLEVL